MNDPFLEIVVIALLLLTNGIFSMSEMAIVSARKTRLQQLADTGNRHARLTLKLADDPNRFLATVQIGITAIGVLVRRVRWRDAGKNDRHLAGHVSRHRAV